MGAEELERLQYGVLMLETSGRARLDTRQACAAESAARRYRVTWVVYSSVTRSIL